MKVILTEQTQKNIYTFEASIFNAEETKILSFTADAESKEDFILRYQEKMREFIGEPNVTFEVQ